MFLLILCVLFSWPVVTIFLYLFCSYHLQIAGKAVAPYVIEIGAVIVTMRLKVPNLLHFQTPFIQ